ncbi:hypothetical protein GRJ2_000662200 [Grus japonensis]|uniref:Uncharacterized protein n=1 Tax=Grus japonensis TaxID=30415 RepID=A0ABC9W8W0_GRUJA
MAPPRPLAPPPPRPCPPVTCVSDSRRRRPLAEGKGGAGPGRPGRQLRAAAITTKGSAERGVGTAVELGATRFGFHIICLPVMPLHVPYLS